MKTAGGLKDILECLCSKSDEQIMVEILLDGKRISLNLNEFKQLLFREEKQPTIKTSISSIINIDDYKERYGVEMIQEFIDYWTEMLPNGKKQRWQKQKAFDVNRRLIAWGKRDYNGLYKEHKYQLEKKRQDDYLREASEKVSEEESERQKKELKKITQGIFVNVKEV